ncbi:MAG: hypothetical protein GY799_17445 [Desulfobulbaceae bacterium]|nr:hypothetical protein [Desulfobulbaceae bacterium]
MKVLIPLAGVKTSVADLSVLPVDTMQGIKGKIRRLLLTATVQETE